MKKFAIALLAVFLTLPLVAQVQAQTAPSSPAINTFSLNATPISLPGNHSTVAGVDAGMTLTLTSNFDLRDDNVLSGDGFMQYFGGGFNYRLPAVSKWLNNASPNLNGYDFQFYLTGSAGIDRVGVNTAATTQHYAFLAGGGVNYMIAGSNTWALGAEVQYAKLPGYNNNTVVVKVGPSVHF